MLSLNRYLGQAIVITLPDGRECRITPKAAIPSEVGVLVKMAVDFPIDCLIESASESEARKSAGITSAEAVAEKTAARAKAKQRTQIRRAK